MGSNTSLLSEDLLDEYSQLTYLHRVEILQIFKRFYSIDPMGVRTSLMYRIIGDEIIKEFHEIKCNPYGDRLIEVFSSYGDGHLSFEDTLDLFSALSKNCPAALKARWVFKIFDFDEDNRLNGADVAKVIDRLCGKKYDHHRSSDFEDGSRHDIYRTLTASEKTEIAQKVIDEMDLDKTGSITTNEFIHAVMKMPDFSRTFTLKP